MQKYGNVIMHKRVYICIFFEQKGVCLFVLTSYENEMESSEANQLKTDDTSRRLYNTNAENNVTCQIRFTKVNQLYIVKSSLLYTDKFKSLISVHIIKIHN